MSGSMVFRLIQIHPFNRALNPSIALYQRVRLKHSANLFRASLVFFNGTVNLREPCSVSLSVGAISNFGMPQILLK